MDKDGKKNGIVKLVLYLLVTLVAAFFVLGTLLLPKAPDVTGGECRAVNDGWVRVLADGTREAVKLPGNVSVPKGETVLIETTVPAFVKDGGWMCFRSSQQDMRVYVGGEFRQSYRTTKSRLFGKTSMSAYVFLKVSREDVGKILQVETVSMSSYNGILNEVYYGDKFGIWWKFLGDYGAESVIAFIMLFMAVVTIIFSIVLKLSYKREIALEYLGWGILLAAVWIISESSIRQLLFPNTFLIGNMAFFAIMLMPLPFLIYINGVQKGRYKIWYMIMECVAVADFLVCTLLQFWNIADFLESLILMHATILIAITGVCITIIMDIVKKEVKSYRLITVGLFIMMIASIAELLQVYGEDRRANGSGLCIGLVFLLIFAIIETGNDLLKAESERRVAMLDKETKVNFLEKMSHEIRTPINTMIGMNEMIARENTDPALEQYIANAQTAGKALLALVNDVLDFSKIKTGNLGLTENVYQTASLITDVVHMLQARAEKKHLEVVVNVEEKLPSCLYGDEVRIRQIVSSLLTNAVKYTKKGTITFSVSGEDCDDGEFFLKIFVADTGEGIQEKDMSRLFEKRESSEDMKIEDGESDLGLGIVKRLLEEMRGSIKVRSVPEKGTLFSVELPQKVIDASPVGMNPNSFAEESRALKIYRSEFTAPEAHILAVDDNDMNLVVVKGLLRRLKLQVDTAGSGTECLELCANKKYDLILMDHMMPEPDGIETLRLLRAQQEGLNFRTPVVVLTANAVAGCREKYLACGFAEYLSKPVVPEKIEKVLREFLPEELIVPVEEQPDDKTETSVTGGKEEITCENPDEQTGAEEDGNEPEGEISRKLGLFYCNDDEEMYEDMLDTYFKQGQIYVQKLPALVEEKDWKNYGIIAHAMKSTSLSIGAKEFSELAKEHEMAGKEENGEWIEKNWEAFYDRYRKVLKEAEKTVQGEKITSARQDEEEPEDVPQEEYEKEWELLLEYVRNYEMNASVEQIRRLKDIRIKGKTQEDEEKLLEKLQELIDEFDYGGAEELLENRKKEAASL